MRIGIDMFLAQQQRRTLAGAFAAGLVRELVSKFTQHEWSLYFHEPVDGIDGCWRDLARVCIAPGSTHAAGMLDGQAALVQASREVDLWLTTAALDRHCRYVPPSSPVDNVRLAGLLLDLAPVVAPDRFVNRSPNVERYRQSVLVLPRYEILLTASESVRLDCCQSLGIDERKVATIGSSGVAEVASIDRLQTSNELASRFFPAAIQSPFVLCQAGDDEDRSIAVMAAALEHITTSQAHACQYVVLTRLSDWLRGAWQQEINRRGLGQRLLLIEPQSNELRRLLIERCEVVIDAEPQEGSALSLLLALQCGAAVIVDHRSPHAKLVGKSAALAESDQPVHLAAKLDELLVDAAALNALRSTAPLATAGHSLSAVAERAMRTLEATAATDVGRALPISFEKSGGRCPPCTIRASRSRPPLAFFSPFLPQRTGISDYSQRLLAALKVHFQIDVFHDECYLPQLSLLSAEFGCRDRRLFERFSRAANYTGIVYQMANTHFCAYLYEMLLKHRGLVVLHDFALPEFHLGYALRYGVPADFLATEIERESPELAAEYRASSDGWRSEPGGPAQAFIRRGLSFNRRILEAAGVVVVHDRWGAEQIARTCPHLVDRVHVIPHGAAVYQVTPDEKRALRERYGFRHDELILSCFGILNGAKYHGEIIELLAAIKDDFPMARLIFVGGDLNEGREQTKAAELGLGDRVRFFGHAPMQTFLELMSITDVAMNLRRPPTRGETSGALLTLLSAGVPTIVTDIDTFASYPDSVVCKIGPLGPHDQSLGHAVRSLLREPNRRRQLGEAAIDYVDRIHSWQRVAALYAEAIEALRPSIAIGDVRRAA